MLQFAVLVDGEAILFGHRATTRRQRVEIHDTNLDQSPWRDAR
jgi:hypothetical protein